MKKVIAAITAGIVLTVTGSALAQMNDKGKEMMKDKTEMTGDKAGMMEGKGGMMGMMKMCQSMMNKPSMVAVGDGVVVLSGKKLYKYDADLNVVKEADVKVEEMSMMGKGMEKTGIDNDDDDKGSEANKPAEDHSAHH